MILLVGLGNPGEKYKKTRHNIGFRVVDDFARKNNFPGFNFEKKFQAEISEGEINGEKILLAKPQTFMNLSGKSVKQLTAYYKISAGNLFIINDDIDIFLGAVKISRESGSAGHKGVKSIIDNLGTQNFVRFRIGVQPAKGKPKNVESFVIKNFSEDEEKNISEIIPKTVDAIGTALNEGIEITMNKYN